jgi:hypothetical protein
MKIESYLQATPREIERRLRRADIAWQMDRAIEQNAAPAALVGALLGAFVDRRFFLVPALVGGWLLLRRLKPAAELAEQREALRLLYSARAAGL